MDLGRQAFGVARERKSRYYPDRDTPKPLRKYQRAQ